MNRLDQYDCRLKRLDLNYELGIVWYYDMSIDIDKCIGAEEKAEPVVIVPQIVKMTRARTEIYIEDCKYNMNLMLQNSQDLDSNKDMADHVKVRIRRALAWRIDELELEIYAYGKSIGDGGYFIDCIVNYLPKFPG